MLKGKQELSLSSGNPYGPQWLFSPTYKWVTNTYVPRINKFTSLEMPNQL